MYGQKVKIMNPQLDLLLKIQALEVKIAGFESEKKKLPIRKQLSEIINEVNSMQSMYTRTEEVVKKMEENCDQMREAYEQCLKKYESAQKKFEELDDETSMEELEKIISTVASVRRSVEKKAADLAKIKQSLEKASKMATDIGKNITSKKEAYDKIKPEYDKLAAEIDEKIAEEKKGIAEIEKGVDEPILKRYKSARSKLNRPPLFELSGTSCRACNMSLSNVVKKKAASEMFAECENCGALLYIKE